MDYIKYISLLTFVLTIACSSNVEQPKRDTLLKLEGIESPLLPAPKSNDSERLSHVNDDRRGNPDVLLQILGLKQPTTTRHPHYPTPPPWHPPKPTHKPHPHPHPPHYPPYPPYPHSPYYPYYPYYYPYWPYPPYGYPPRPPRPPPTRPPPGPTPGPTPQPTPPGAPPQPGAEPPPPTMEQQNDPIYYQLRTDNIDNDDDDDGIDNTKSVLKIHKKKTRRNRFPAGRPHIVRISS